MSRLLMLGLVSVLIVAVGLAVSPVDADVQGVSISPSVLAVGQPITFSGSVVESSASGFNTLTSETLVQLAIHSGPNCPSSQPTIAFAEIGTGSRIFPNNYGYVYSYNTTLSFPAQSSPRWTVQQPYENGFPAGTYSVYVIDYFTNNGGQFSTAGSSLCQSFTVTGAVPEFSDTTLNVFLTPVTCLSLLSVCRKRIISRSIATA